MVNLAKTSADESIELDLKFGHEPLGIACLTRDKAAIATGTIVLTWLAGIAAGPLGAALVLYIGVNDLRLKGESRESFKWLEVPEDEEYEGPTVEAEAETVESEEFWQGYQYKEEDDTPTDVLGNPIQKVEPQTWPPPSPSDLNGRLNEMAYQEAKDLVIDGPQALLEMLGDSAPDWVRTAAGEGAPADMQTSEPPSFTMVRAVHEPVAEPVLASEPTNNQCSPTPVAEPVRGYSDALAKAVQQGPYPVPDIGKKPAAYHAIRTAMALDKSQNWIVENIFGASKGSNTLYRNSVAYIKWAKGA